MSHVLFSRLSFGVAMTVLMGSSLWVSPLWAERKTPAPVVDATGAGGAGASVEARLTRLERLLENQTLLELMERMDSLQNEVQRMLSESEEQTHNMEGLKKRQRDIYLDIDQRLRKIEQGGVSTQNQAPAMGAFVPTPVPATTPDVGTPLSSAPGVTSPAPAVSSQNTGPSVATDPQQERIAYEKAFSQLKDGRYDQAVAAFKEFVKSYPKGRFVGNAQYWLGEANYVQRNYKLALSDFEKVVKNYPTSPKRADAMLKMGYTYQELGRLDEAKISLNNVLKSYPNSTAANLAQKRLQDIKRLQ